MPTLSSVPERKRLYDKILFYFRWRGNKVERKADAMLRHIDAYTNQQIKSVLDELEGEAEAFERTSKKRDGLTHFAVPLSTIQKIRSRYE